MVDVDFYMHLVFSFGLVLILFQSLKSFDRLYRGVWPYLLVISTLFVGYLGYIKEFLDEINPVGAGFSTSDVIANHLGVGAAYVLLLSIEAYRDYKFDRHLEEIVVRLKEDG